MIYYLSLSKWNYYVQLPALKVYMNIFSLNNSFSII